jgi:hypothetical protein
MAMTHILTYLLPQPGAEVDQDTICLFVCLETLLTQGIITYAQSNDCCCNYNDNGDQQTSNSSNSTNNVKNMEFGNVHPIESNDLVSIPQNWVEFPQIPVEERDMKVAPLS